MTEDDRRGVNRKLVVATSVLGALVLGGQFFNMVILPAKASGAFSNRLTTVETTVASNVLGIRDCEEHLHDELMEVRESTAGAFVLIREDVSAVKTAVESLRHDQDRNRLEQREDMKELRAMFVDIKNDG